MTIFEFFSKQKKKKSRTRANFRILIFFRGLYLRIFRIFLSGEFYDKKIIIFTKKWVVNLGITSETTWGSRVKRPGVGIPYCCASRLPKKPWSSIEFHGISSWIPGGSPQEEPGGPMEELLCASDLGPGATYLEMHMCNRNLRLRNPSE